MDTNQLSAVDRADLLQSIRARSSTRREAEATVKEIERHLTMDADLRRGDARERAVRIQASLNAAQYIVDRTSGFKFWSPARDAKERHTWMPAKCWTRPEVDPAAVSLEERIAHPKMRAKLRWYITRREFNLDTAEELVSQTIEVGLRRAGQYDPQRAGLATWLYRIADGLRANFYRARSRRPRPSADSASVGITPNVDRELDLAAALEKLSAKQREAIELKINGLTGKEAAGKLSISSKTFESRLNAGAEALKKLLGKEAVYSNEPAITEEATTEVNEALESFALPDDEAADGDFQPSVNRIGGKTGYDRTLDTSRVM